MTPETVSMCIIGLFIIILLAGFLFGVARGFNKSIVRLLLVLAMLVISFYVTPLFSKWVMTLNITNFGIQIEGETVTTVAELITNLLNSIPEVADLTGTPAYATIVEVLPQMIVNIVLFVVFFYLLRAISMIIYWIIAGVCFNKKKTEGKNKHRLLGSVVGVVQSFVVFLVLLVPCVGVINTLGHMETLTTTPAATASTMSTTQETPTEEESNGITETVNTINEIIDAYNDTWVAKMLHSVKLDKACDYVFDELTTIEKDNVQYNLEEEVASIVVVYQDIVKLQDAGGLDLNKKENIEILQTIIEDVYKSKFGASLINDALDIAIQKWTMDPPETFMGIAKPEIDGYQEVLDDLLQKLASTTDKKDNLISLVNVAKSLIVTANNIVAADGTVNMEAIGELLTELTSDPNTRDLARDVIVDNLETISTEAGLGDYTDSITEAITSIFDESVTQEQLAPEIEVVTDILGVANNLANGESLDETAAEEIIDSLVNSTIIYDTVTDDESKIREVIQDSLDDNSKAEIDKVIDNLIAAEGATESEIAKLNELKELFTKSSS